MGDGLCGSYSPPPILPPLVVVLLLLLLLLFLFCLPFLSSSSSSSSSSVPAFLLLPSSSAFFPFSPITLFLFFLPCLFFSSPASSHCHSVSSTSSSATRRVPFFHASLLLEGLLSQGVRQRQFGLVAEPLSLATPPRLSFKATTNNRNSEPWSSPRPQNSMRT